MLIPTAAARAAAAAAATATAASSASISISSGGGGGNTLRMYRRLLGLARQMQPAERRAAALHQIREGFRQHAQERDEERCVLIGCVGLEGSDCWRWGLGGGAV